MAADGEGIALLHRRQRAFASSRVRSYLELLAHTQRLHPLATEAASYAAHFVVPLTVRVDVAQKRAESVPAATPRRCRSGLIHYADARGAADRSAAAPQVVETGSPASNATRLLQRAGNCHLLRWPVL